MEYTKTGLYGLVGGFLIYVMGHFFGINLVSPDVQDAVGQAVALAGAIKTAWDHRTLAKAVSVSGLQIKGL